MARERLMYSIASGAFSNSSFGWASVPRFRIVLRLSSADAIEPKTFLASPSCGIVEENSGKVSRMILNSAVSEGSAGTAAPRSEQSFFK